VIKTNATFIQQAGFAMPVSGSVAAVRGLLPQGWVSAAATGKKRHDVDMAQVCAYTVITDVAVLEDVFPGTSAWSPPI
jgi:hypothetical protein